MKKLDDMFGENERKVRNAAAPAEFEGKVLDAVQRRTSVHTTNKRLDGAEKPLSMRILQYALSAVAFVTVLGLMVLIFPHSKTPSGGSPENSESITATATATPQPMTQLSQEEIDNNNRANFANGGHVFEDADYIYYSSIGQANALYKMDKKTGNRMKLADAIPYADNIDPMSTFSTRVMMIAGVWDDKVYFIGCDPEAFAIDNGFTNALYSVRKNGTDRKKLISGIPECVIRSGSAYFFSRGDSGAGTSYGLFRYDLTTGSTETLSADFAGAKLIPNDVGDKLYYARASSENMKSIYEFDLITKTERKLYDIGNWDQDMSGLASIEYYNDSVYFVFRGKLEKFDLPTGSVEIISSGPNAGGGYITAFAATDSGAYFKAYDATSEKTIIYRVKDSAQVRIAESRIKSNLNYFAPAGGYLFVTDVADDGVTMCVRLYMADGTATGMIL